MDEIKEFMSRMFEVESNCDTRQYKSKCIFFKSGDVIKIEDDKRGEMCFMIIEFKDKYGLLHMKSGRVINTEYTLLEDIAEEHFSYLKEVVSLEDLLINPIK